MNEMTRSSIKLTHRFVSEHGTGILTKMGEAPINNAQWHMSSHGAVIRVEGEHDEIFERLVIIVPRPPDAQPERFREWVEARIEHYGWYLELTNTGRCVHSSIHGMCAVVTIMRRLGRSTADPSFALPPHNEILGVLGAFVRNLERYVEYLGDADLRYVNAMRVYDVPRVNRPNQQVIGLDVLPTIIGLDRESNSIHPLTLARGIIGEFAELYDQAREGLDAGEGSFNPAKTRRKRKALTSLNETVNNLDRVCGNIDLHRPALATVIEWLAEAEAPPERKPRKGSMVITLVLIALCVALAFHLAQ
jgi:hypothetical protein